MKDSNTGIFLFRGDCPTSRSTCPQVFIPLVPTTTQWQQPPHTVGAPPSAANSFPPRPRALRCSAPARSEGAPRADPAPWRAPAAPTVQWASLYPAPPDFPGCLRLSGAQARRQAGTVAGDPGRSLGVVLGTRAGTTSKFPVARCGVGVGVAVPDRFWEECPRRDRDL